MAYQFTQTGAEIQDILNQVGTNTQDIGTINAALTQMTTVHSETFTDSTTGITVIAKKCGNVLQVAISGNVTAPASWTVIGTLSANCRPSNNLPYTTLVNQGTLASKMLLSIYANGQVRVNASAGAISGVYFNAVATFIAE